MYTLNTNKASKETKSYLNIKYRQDTELGLSGSIKIPLSILNINTDDLYSTDKIVLALISKFVAKKNPTSIANRVIASLIGGASPRTISRSIARLAEKGFIEVHQVKNPATNNFKRVITLGSKITSEN